MAGYTGNDKCPGSGMPPRDSKVYNTEESEWEWGTCAVCGRILCAITKQGLVRAHKREDHRKDLVSIIEMVDSTQRLLNEIKRELEKLDLPALCTRDETCHNFEYGSALDQRRW